MCTYVFQPGWYITIHVQDVPREFMGRSTLTYSYSLHMYHGIGVPTLTLGFTDTNLTLSLTIKLTLTSLTCCTVMYAVV